MREEDKSLVSRALMDSEWANLTEREQKYIELSFDASGNRKASLLEVSRKLWRIGTTKETLGDPVATGISSQRVREIHDKVLRKLHRRTNDNPNR
jgi:DNA-directed RNA polymerase sigma subunit (sigma70/sigma32)